MGIERRGAGGPDIGARLFLAVIVSLIFAVPAAVLLLGVLYLCIDVILDLDQMEHKLLIYGAWCLGISYGSCFLLILLCLPESTLKERTLAGSPTFSAQPVTPPGQVPAEPRQPEPR